MADSGSFGGPGTSPLELSVSLLDTAGVDGPVRAASVDDAVAEQPCRRMAILEEHRATPQGEGGKVSFTASSTGIPSSSGISSNTTSLQKDQVDEECGVMCAEEGVAPISMRRGQSAREMGTEGLPDLTDRLHQWGIYHEYYEFRRQYLQWRKGDSRGAAGEATARVFEHAAGVGNRSPAAGRFDRWYPTAEVFRWRSTASYWSAILFLLGSYCFVYACAVGLFCEGRPGAHILATWPSAIGSVFFTLGIYASYLQLLNIHTVKEGQRVNYFTTDWHRLMETEDMHVTWESVIGTLSNLVGATLFMVGAWTEVLPHFSVGVRMWVVGFPNSVGSVLFCVAAVCEFIHNKMHRPGGPSCKDKVWWACYLNLFGSILFLTGSLPDLIGSSWDPKVREDVASASIGIGSVFFVFFSVILIMMWRSNDFGLTLLKQLNMAIGEGNTVVAGITPAGTAGLQILPAPGSGLLGPIPLHRHVVCPDGSRACEQEGAASGAPLAHPVTPAPHPRVKKTFSTRGIAFIVIYVWFVFVAMIGTMQRHWRYSIHHSECPFRQAWLVIQQVFIVCVLVLVLVLHSVVTFVPNEQPYRAAVILGRAICLIGAVAQTADVLAFLVYADKPV